MLASCLAKACITAEVCAFHLTFAVTERDIGSCDVRVWPSESGLADDCHQRSTAELPIKRHPWRETDASRTTHARERPTGAPGSRAEVAVDPVRGRQDPLAPARRRRGGQGPGGAGELQGLRRARRADRGGERGDLRGQAGHTRYERSPAGQAGERGLRAALATEKSAEIGRPAAEAPPVTGLRCGAGGGRGGASRRDAEAGRRHAGVAAGCRSRLLGPTGGLRPGPGRCPKASATHAA
jgi:hypothetical protein